jgi:hypothetical protein
MDITVNRNTAGNQWLTSVILATQEAEIRRITVQNQPRKIVHETLSQKSSHKKGAGIVAQRPRVQAPVLQKKKILSFLHNR